MRTQRVAAWGVVLIGALLWLRADFTASAGGAAAPGSAAGTVWRVAAAAPAALAGQVLTVVRGEVAYEAASRLGRWRGRNPAITGSFQFDPSSGSVRGRVCIDMRQWNSGNRLRDLHTRRMFETERYPTACFAPSRLLGEPGAAGILEGDLFLRFEQRPLRIAGTWSWDGQSLRFEGGFEARLTEWGLNPPRLAGIEVQDEVSVFIWLNAAPEALQAGVEGDRSPAGAGTQLQSALGLRRAARG